MAEKSVYTVPGTSLPASVDVIAPSDMPEGYQLNVESGGKTFLVAVPAGGVKAGTRFSAMVVAEEVSTPHDIPTGDWRDGLCDCCKFGCCHPLLCCSFWCSTCALGQIMQRVGLNYLGNPIEPGDKPSMKTCRFIFFMGILAVVVGLFISAGLGWLLWIVYFLIIAIQTRRYLRNKYNIQTKHCGNLEDCCCAFWCTTCTVSQMGRHTADFERYNASCCSETGLKAGAPAPAIA